MIRMTYDALHTMLTRRLDRMDQMVHLSWFLAKYQQWWTMKRVRLVIELDFAVLMLRICSYASQFLPSPGYTLDKIRGMLLTDVRNTCDETADSLAAISTASDGRGSLIRVQHLGFLGLRCQIEGKTTAFWEVLSRAVRVAQSLGIHSDAARSRQDLDRADQEMERRAFCNLYIWDSQLSLQLDRIAFLPESLCPGNWPQLNLLGSGSGYDGESIGTDVESLDPFTERLLQARLADFWRKIGPTQGAEYDMMVAEERYNKFCHEYLSELSPAFALVDPDETWDKRLPKLPLQRQLLHIAIYDSLCRNFRPLLLRRSLPIPADQDHRESPPLPTYKRVLLGSQEKELAVAALRTLDCATSLHTLLGGCHTRFTGLIFSTFEAAVLLVYLCMDPMFPRDWQHQQVPPAGAVNNKTDPLQAGIRNITRQGCMQAVQGALKRLRMLAEVSSMAEVGASTLARCLNKASENSTGTDEVAPSQSHEVGNTTTASSQLVATSAAGDVANWLPCDPADMRSMNDSMSVSDMAGWPSVGTSSMNLQEDFVSISATQDIQNSWATPITLDFSQ